MNKNINNFKKTILVSIIFPLLLLPLLTSLIFYLIYIHNYNQTQISGKNEIISSNKLYQSQLSESIAIVTSSNIFKDFLTSGPITRKEILPQFLEQTLPLRSNGMTGFSIFNDENNSEFISGKTSDKKIIIKLCYLSGKLNNLYGNCEYQLKLYFSNQEVTNAIKKINKKIDICENCEKINLFSEEKLGSFPILHTSNLNIGLKIKNQDKTILYSYLFSMIILIIFSFKTILKTHKIIKSVIADPIEELVNNIKNNLPRNKSKNSLYEINYLIDQINIWEKRIDESKLLESQANLGKMATEVAHDIRSPIAVIEMILATESIDDNKYLIKEAVNNIREIANNLLNRYQTAKNPSKSFFLCKLIDEIILHKKHEWKLNPAEIHFEKDISDFLISFDNNKIKRLISNLLNNAYESLENKREIHLKLNYLNNKAILLICDTGAGIPYHMIESVLRGKSLKIQGNGIGLSSAYEYMKLIGGNLELFSEVNIGTQVKLTFPKN